MCCLLVRTTSKAQVGWAAFGRLPLARVRPSGERLVGPAHCCTAPPHSAPATTRARDEQKVDEGRETIRLLMSTMAQHAGWRSDLVHSSRKRLSPHEHQVFKQFVQPDLPDERATASPVEIAQVLSNSASSFGTKFSSGK